MEKRNAVVRADFMPKDIHYFTGLWPDLGFDSRRYDLPENFAELSAR